jgi:hypothetical protein
VAAPSDCVAPSSSRCSATRSSPSSNVCADHHRGHATRKRAHTDIRAGTAPPLRMCMHARVYSTPCTTLHMRPRHMRVRHTPHNLRFAGTTFTRMNVLHLWDWVSNDLAERHSHRSLRTSPHRSLHTSPHLSLRTSPFTGEQRPRRTRHQDPRRLRLRLRRLRACRHRPGSRSIDPTRDVPTR